MTWSHTERTAGLAPVIDKQISEGIDILENPALGWEFQEFVSPTLTIEDGVTKAKIPWYDSEDDRAEQTLVHTPGQKPARVDGSRPLFRDATLKPRSDMINWHDGEAGEIAMSGRSPDKVFASRIDMAARKLWLDRHAALSAILTTSARYDSNARVAAGDAWSAAAGNPEANVMAVRTAVRALRKGVTVNAMLINDIAASHLRRSAAMRAIIGSDRTKILTDEDIMLIFELDHFRVTGARYDSGRAGDTAAYARILGNSAILFYKPPVVSPSDFGPVEFMRTLRNGPKEISYEMKNFPELSPGKGGYYEEHYLKEGYYTHELVDVAAVGTIESTCAGIVTGIY